MALARLKQSGPHGNLRLIEQREETVVLHELDRTAGADLWLLGTVGILLAISVLMVFSTTAFASQQTYGETTAMIRRHLAHVLAGMICCGILSRMHPNLLYKSAMPLLCAALAILAVVLIPQVGHRAGGAQRWLVLGPLRVQPGEIAKLAVILYTAVYLDRNYHLMTRFVPGVLLPFAVVGLFGVLLLLQPDFGSTAVIFIVVLCQLCTATRIRHLLSIAFAGSLALASLAIIEPYRFRRLVSFLNPLEEASGTGYQLVQSLIAVGSGGYFGVGLGAGKQKLFYLPAAHTDFIYAVIAEELGLAGAVFVLGLFMVILFRGLRIASRLSRSPFLTGLAVGCTMLIVLPALLNMGVVLGLLPTKGLVLPLVAYGGTAMLVHLAAIGVLLRLSAMSVD